MNSDCNDGVDMRDVRRSLLLEEMDKLYARLNRGHAQGLGVLNQIIQRRETQSDNEHAIAFSVEPLGVQIRYSRQVLPAEGQEDVKVVKERIRFTGSHSPGRVMDNQFFISVKTGDVLESGDVPQPFRRAAVDNSAEVLRNYLEVCFEQTAESMELDGLLSHPAEIITGVKGVRRKLNLGHVEDFNDPAGEPYTRTTFEDIVIPAITDVYYRISFVGYDRLFILERGLLIDCGDCSVLEDIVDGAKDNAKDLDFGMNGGSVFSERSSVHPGSKESVRFTDIESAFKFRESFYANRDRMSVYEHENDFIYLFEGLFPKSGSVYVYTGNPDIVKRIFSYAFQRRTKEHTRVDGDWLVFDDKGLRISFLGKKAEAEFERLTESMYDEHLPNLRKVRIVSDILD